MFVQPVGPHVVLVADLVHGVRHGLVIGDDSRAGLEISFVAPTAAYVGYPDVPAPGTPLAWKFRS